MTQARRGPLLTTLAVLFGALAVSNLLKPLELGATTGFVFLGERLHGIWNAVLGPLFGIYLAAYAYGIARMRRFALTMGKLYAAYVIVNLVAWNLRQENPVELGVAFGVVYVLVAVGVSAGAVLALRRRADELT